MDQDDLSDPFRVVTEEDFQCMQLLRNAFNIIQAVNADHKLHSLELLFKHRYPLLHLLFLKSLLELLRIDTYRKSATSDNLSLEFDPIWRCSQTPKKSASNLLERSDLLQ